MIFHIILLFMGLIILIGTYKNRHEIEKPKFSTINEGFETKYNKFKNAIDYISAIGYIFIGLSYFYFNEYLFSGIIYTIPYLFDIFTSYLLRKKYTR